jgi:hypothetical protein
MDDNEMLVQLHERRAAPMEGVATISYTMLNDRFGLEEVVLEAYP